MLEIQSHRFLIPIYLPCQLSVSGRYGKEIGALAAIIASLEFRQRFRKRGSPSSSIITRVWILNLNDLRPAISPIEKE